MLSDICRRSLPRYARPSLLLAHLVIILLGHVACGRLVPETLTPAPTSTRLVDVRRQPDPLPSEAPPKTAVPSPLPTRIPPSPQPPTPTTRRTIIVAVSHSWADETLRAMDGAATISHVDWQIKPHDDPRTALVGNEAQLALANDDNGILVRRTPRALAVPFTSNQEDLSLEQALALSANGSQDILIVPWVDLSPKLRSLRVAGLHPSDPDYPLQDSWSVTAALGFEPDAEIFSQLLRDSLKPDRVAHLAGVGDIMLARALGYAIEQGDVDFPFREIASLLVTADITVGNLESAVGDQGKPEPKRYPFRAPSQAAESLARAGFDIVSLANNHGMDYGSEAMLQAIELLQTAGVTPVGAGTTLAAATQAKIMTAKGLDIAFLGFVNVPSEVGGFDASIWSATASSAGLAWGEPETIKVAISRVREEVDLLVVLLHSGYEYVEMPSPPQQTLARAAIEAGADLVLGHHAHVLQGVEFYQDGVIAYGLGNFAFEIDGPPETVVLNVWLDEQGVRELEFVPAIVQFGGQPRPAEPWEAAPIQQRLNWLTDQLNN